MDAAHDYTDERIKKLEGVIEKHYSQALGEMLDKQAAFMEDYAVENSRLLGLLKNEEITKAEYKSMIKSYTIRAEWYKNMVDSLSTELLNADVKAMEIVRNYMPSVYAENYNFATYKIEKAASVSTNFTLIDESTFRRLVTNNPTLINNWTVHERKDLAWNRRHISSAVMQGVLQGESIPKIAKRIASVDGMSMRNAKKAARTAMTAAQNMGRWDSYKRAEGSGIKLKKQWVATLDSRTRESHRMCDGETVDINAEFSCGLAYPGDPSGQAAEVANCRCTMVAEVEGVDTSDALRASKLDGVSYKEWKAGR